MHGAASALASSQWPGAAKKSLRNMHLLKNRHIITNAESHLRDASKGKLYWSMQCRELLEPINLSKVKVQVASNADLSSSRQDAGGAPTASMPDQSEDGECKLRRQDTFKEEQDPQFKIGGPGSDSYQVQCAADQRQLIMDAFPESNIPVTNMDAYVVEKVLDAGKST